MFLILSNKTCFWCHFIHSDLKPVHGFHCKTLLRNAEIIIGLAAFSAMNFNLSKNKINRELNYGRKKMK